jgi:IS30 family transposase
VVGKRGRPFRDQDAADRADLARRIAEGQTNREIAEELGLHIDTICKRVKRYGLKGVREDNRFQGDPWGQMLNHAVNEYYRNKGNREQE